MSVMNRDALIQLARDIAKRNWTQEESADLAVSLDSPIFGGCNVVFPIIIDGTKPWVA